MIIAQLLQTIHNLLYPLPAKLAHVALFWGCTVTAFLESMEHCFSRLPSIANISARIGDFRVSKLDQRNSLPIQVFKLTLAYDIELQGFTILSVAVGHYNRSLTRTPNLVCSIASQFPMLYKRGYSLKEQLVVVCIIY